MKKVIVAMLFATVALCTGAARSYAGCHSSCYMTQYACLTGHNCGVCKVHTALQDCSTCNYSTLSTGQLPSQKDSVLAFLNGAADLFATPAYATHTDDGDFWGVRDNTNQSSNGRLKADSAKLDACLHQGHAEMPASPVKQDCMDACDSVTRNLGCSTGNCEGLCNILF